MRESFNHRRAPVSDAIQPPDHGDEAVMDDDPSDAGEHRHKLEIREKDEYLTVVEPRDTFPNCF